MVTKLEIEREPTIKYQCDICKKEWFSKEFALKCEEEHDASSGLSEGDK